MQEDVGGLTKAVTLIRYILMAKGERFIMIIIYGAGKYGKTVKAFLNSYDIPVHYFCETEAVGDRLIDGVQFCHYMSYQIFWMRSL